MVCIPLEGGFVCCDIEYVKFFDDAARRHRRGERQLYCSVCRKWRWPGECERRAKNEEVV